MANINMFAKRMAGRAVQVLINAPKATRKVSLAAIGALAENTPVDTTLARSNWVAAIGGPDLSPRGFRSISAVKEEARSKLAALEADQEAHVANGGDKVPYLKLLNAGSSSQAPAGFFQGAVLVAQAALENVQLLGN